MQFKLILCLAVVLEAALPSFGQVPLASTSYPNLYKAAQVKSPKFAELIDRAGMKDKLSGAYDGTLLIPSEAAMKGIPGAMTHEVARTIVRQHMLPGTILKPQVKSRKVKTALKGDTVKIVTSPYGKHNMRIYYNNNRNYANVVEKDIPIAIKKSHAALVNKLMAMDVKLPTFSASNICQTFDKDPCIKLGIVEQALHTAGKSLSACKVPPAGAQVMPTTDLGVLPDRRPLPQSFALDAIAPEGGSYYWLYRMLENLESWSICEAHNNGQILKAPEGWTVLKTIPLPQAPGSPAIRFTAIMINDAKDHLTILNRGTMSGYEWAIDFSYNSSYIDQNPSLKSLFPSPTHYGFSNVLSIMWKGGVQDALDNLVIGGTVKSVTISGHSLGAGVSTLMSYAAQKYLNNNNADVKVDAVLFAPPNAGPPAFTDAFNKLVNGRRVAFEYDVVTKVPCTPDMFACATDKLWGWPLATNMPGNVKSWNYGQVAGTVLLTGESMPFDSETWSKLDDIPVQDAVPFLLSTHVCSYLCYFSQYAGSADGANCWLSLKSAIATGSQCPGFPKKNYP